MGHYKSFKRQGSLIIRDRAPKILSSLSLNLPKESTDKNKVSRLTASETQRNIGSVTFFLDAKAFEENVRTKSFESTEMWLAIRDITIAPNAKLSVSETSNVVLVTTNTSELDWKYFKCDHSNSSCGLLLALKIMFATSISSWKLKRQTAFTWALNASTSPQCICSWIIIKKWDELWSILRTSSSLLFTFHGN